MNWKPYVLIAKPFTTSNTSHCDMPSWSITASGSPRCAKRLTALLKLTQRNVTGKVTLGLYRGNVRVLDRQSPNSLYDTSIGSFVMSKDYDQKDAEGFINILGSAVAHRGRSAQEAGSEAHAEEEKMKLWGGALQRRARPAVRKVLRVLSLDQRFVLVRPARQSGLREGAGAGACPEAARGRASIRRPGGAAPQSRA